MSKGPLFPLLLKKIGSANDHPGKDADSGGCRIQSETHPAVEPEPLAHFVGQGAQREYTPWLNIIKVLPGKLALYAKVILKLVRYGDRALPARRPAVAVFTPDIKVCDIDVHVRFAELLTQQCPYLVVETPRAESFLSAG